MKSIKKISRKFLPRKLWPVSEIHNVPLIIFRPRSAFAAIKKKMNSPNPHSAYYALLVLESVVKNCGTPMHDEVFTMDNCKMFTHYLKTRPDQNVRAKILELVQTWAYAFRSSEKYQSIKACIYVCMSVTTAHY